MGKLKPFQLKQDELGFDYFEYNEGEIRVYPHDIVNLTGYTKVVCVHGNETHKPFEGICNRCTNFIEPESKLESEEVENA